MITSLDQDIYLFMQTIQRTFQPFFEILAEIRETSEKQGSKRTQFALVESFWHIGRLIVENEQAGEEKALYGENLLDSLASELSITFGKGYTPTNLRWARQLYLTYPIHHTVCDKIEISKEIHTSLHWSHHRKLLSIQDHEERNFYVEQVAENNWSVRFLKKMIDADFYRTRDETYSLPQRKNKGGTNWRQQKSLAKSKGMLTRNWAFIHPKTLHLPQTELLFFHLNAEVFIVLSNQPIGELRLVDLQSRLKKAFGKERKIVPFLLTPVNQIQPVGTVEKIAIKLQAEYNKST